MHAAKTLGRAGATRTLTAFSRPKSIRVAPAHPEQLGAVFWPRQDSENARRNAGRKTRSGNEEKGPSMAIIKAPPKQPKSVTIQARVEESVKTQLGQYAKFIDSTPSYVITEALKVLFKRDDEFKTWLGQQPRDGKIQELKGGGLKETA